MNITGRTLGQFRIIEPIGQGGMAAVYKAYQPSLDRYVAVKVLPAQHALTPGFSERFVREARAIAQLSHPNILPVIDFGQDGDLSYIVMKYVPAGTLKDRMGHPMNLQAATQLIESTAAALDHAHARGVLHRDVKPSNVLLDEDDWVLLADFGLAKMIAGDEGLTGSGVGIGTPAYMSPEQGQGDKVDVHTDVYALGVILYEMVTGQLPFDAETPLAIVMKHITEPTPLPRKFRPDLPQAVERVILKATAKTPEDRFASAGELAQALRAGITPTRVPHAAPTAETPPDLPHLYTQALGFFYTEQWNKAIEALEAIVAVDPEFERGDAARRLDEARKQQRLADLFAKAQAAMAREEWSAAVGGLNEIVAAAPDYRNAQALLARAQRRRELADLYGDARRLHNSGQWQAVVNVWERIRSLDANYADPDSLLSSAQSELVRERAQAEERRQAEEREQRLAEWYRRGLDHVAADQWDEAVAVLEEITTLEPDYQETSGLLARARREIAQRQAPLSLPEPVVAARPSAPPKPSVVTPRRARQYPISRRGMLIAGGAAAIVALVLVVLAVVLSGGGEEATPPVAGGETVEAQVDTDAVSGTVFVSNRDGKIEVYRVVSATNGRLDTTDTVRWTQTPGDSESWDPVMDSGGTMVFTSDRDGKREVYRIEPSGEVLRWTHSPAGSESWYPAVLPDGTLVFVSDRDGKREIYRMERSGEVLRWTHSPDDSESWAPSVVSDGLLMFVSDRDGKREIYRMERSGEVLRWTHSPGDSGSWSPAVAPDGTFYFTSNRDGKREIYRLERSGEVARWTHSPGDSESWAPTIAPDGTLLFNSNRDGRLEIYHIDRSGDVQRLTETPGRGSSWLRSSEE